MAAPVVLPGGAGAVPSPVPEGTDDLIEPRIVRVNSAAFSHGHVMRGIKAGSPDIPHRTRKNGFRIYAIFAAKGVAVVFHQPQPMTVTELLHRLQIKGIPQGVGQHHRLCPLTAGLLQPRHIHIVLGDGDIHKDRHRPILHHGRYRGGKACSHRDHLIAPPDLPFAEKR